MSTASRPAWEPFAYTYNPTHLQQLVPTGVRPSSDFVFEVRRALEAHADDPAALAQWVAERIEEYGAQRARPVFDMEGNGPRCSWCGALAMVCQHGSED